MLLLAYAAGAMLEDTFSTHLLIHLQNPQNKSLLPNANETPTQQYTAGKADGLVKRSGRVQVYRSIESCLSMLHLSAVTS